MKEDEALRRDNYRCQVCGRKKGSVNVLIHHINGNNQNNDPENLVTLCVGCHLRLHGKSRTYGNYAIVTDNKGRNLTKLWRKSQGLRYP